jgi:hypothetical protein
MRSARNSFRFAGLGAVVNSELPLPASFEIASAFIREEDLVALMAVGPDPQEYLALAQRYVDAGYDRLSLLNSGPDVDGFLDFAGEHLIKKMRALSPRS